MLITVHPYGISAPWSPIWYVITDPIQVFSRTAYTVDLLNSSSCQKPPLLHDSIESLLHFVSQSPKNSWLSADLFILCHELCCIQLRRFMFQLACTILIWFDSVLTDIVEPWLISCYQKRVFVVIFFPVFVSSSSTSRGCPPVRRKYVPDWLRIEQMRQKTFVVTLQTA